MSTRPHIAIVSQQCDSIRSGVGTYAKTLVKALLEKDCRLTLICPEEADGKPSPSSLKLVRVPRARLGSAMRWIPLAWSFARALRDLGRSDPPDLVYFVDAREAVFSRPNCPTLGTIHDGYAAACPWNPLKLRAHYTDWLARWVYYQLTALLEGFALRRYTALHYVSEFTRRQTRLRHRFTVPLERTEYLGLDVSSFPSRDDLPLLADRVPGRILTIGGNPERKGVHLLVRALPALLEVVPEAHLVIAGGEPHQGIMRTARALGVEHAVHWLGWQTPGQLREQYLRASVFAMPSLVESLGLVYLEASLCGLPVLASSRSGLPEIMGKDAIHYCDPESLSCVERGLFKLLTDRRYAHGLMACAATQAAEREIGAVADRVAELFQEVISLDRS